MFLTYLGRVKLMQLAIIQPTNKFHQCIKSFFQQKLYVTELYRMFTIVFVC